jgi:signal transduction histidine kinase
MPKGGTLRLAARADTTAAVRRSILTVEDEGVGIPPEEVDKIFQPFRGSFGKGTGLGLAIVHRLVTDYGGFIDVRPRDGGGTLFRITFPVPVDAGAARQAS